MYELNQANERQLFPALPSTPHFLLSSPNSRTPSLTCTSSFSSYNFSASSLDLACIPLRVYPPLDDHAPFVLLSVPSPPGLVFIAVEKPCAPLQRPQGLRTADHATTHLTDQFVLCLRCQQ